MADRRRFEFGFEPRYRRASRLFGIRPDTAWIEVGDETLTVRFGPWRVATPLANIADVTITGPYAYIKTAGPARLGITDRGLTFATNGRRGVRLQFREPITGMDPWGALRHPNLTLTAADCAGLAAALRR